MSIISRYPTFSMADLEEPHSISAAPRPHISCARHIERRVVHLWKLVTRSTRKNQRASFLPKDFILVTSRRRSAILHNAYHNAYYN
ncbi:hypothetical protein Hypma_003719 [Hypsizygus marmoreus]|uniref:Uncharacterized protein n=1 Tax=Hypsizygus marmoreus TaxID=39966 RepID=A0A369J810_HYPMA|nr:hypothetical protein Hypma_003719 [Hypsizygus marmoreus]